MNILWALLLGIVIGILIWAIAFRCAERERVSTIDQAYEMIVKNPSAAGKK